MLAILDHFFLSENVDVLISCEAKNGEHDLVVSIHCFHYRLKFCKVHTESLVLEPLFNKLAGWRHLSLLKKDSGTGIFLESWEIFNDAYFAKHVWAAASEFWPIVIIDKLRIFHFTFKYLRKSEVVCRYSPHLNAFSSTEHNMMMNYYRRLENEKFFM